MHTPNKKILLRSSWQTVNIGDIAHTPGLLTLLEKHLPEHEVWLWPTDVRNGVEGLLRQRFPYLRIVQTESDIEAAFAECDFLLHGSGPYLVGAEEVARWRNATGKPYGVFGITLPAGFAGPEVVHLLSGARFAYFRDSVSLALAREHGVNCQDMAFVPDAAFAVDLRNDAPAEAFLAANGLKEGRFLCCIGRFRNTPYWRIPSKNMPMDAAKHARNEALKEQDHAPLREAILQIVRGTDLKILLCPEDETQMGVNKEMIYDLLPEAARSRVVWREQYWLTDEALSTYVRSAGLFGHEMHSPILCVGNGIPAMVVRWAEQTSKGFMWRDIGLPDWLFDFDQTIDRECFPAAALHWAQHLPKARARAAEARAMVESLHSAAMQKLGQELKEF
ncbi:MAG: polysaccharide pyruvyl transferase family protein [Kiritimatiellia bacterium]